MSEWRLYRPLIDAWEAEGFRTASQVTDPGGSRWEVDVVAFTPALDDVRITEVKTAPSQALVAQCVDRLEMAPRVYAAVPVEHGEALLEAASGELADRLGVLAVARDGVERLREAVPTPEARKESRAHVLERALRASLV